MGNGNIYISEKQLIFGEAKQNSCVNATSNGWKTSMICVQNLVPIGS